MAGGKTENPEKNPLAREKTNNKLSLHMVPGARFSKLLVITGPVKLFCFPFQMGVLKLLKVIQ